MYIKGHTHTHIGAVAAAAHVSGLDIEKSRLINKIIKAKKNKTRIVCSILNSFENTSLQSSTTFSPLCSSCICLNQTMSMTL